MFVRCSAQSVIVRHDCTCSISPALYECTDIQLPYFTDRSHLYTLRSNYSQNTIYISMLLLLGGIEANPGPAISATSLKLGVFNVHSAVHKAPLIHDVTTDRFARCHGNLDIGKSSCSHYSWHSACRMSSDPSLQGTRCCRRWCCTHSCRQFTGGSGAILHCYQWCRLSSIKDSHTL